MCKLKINLLLTAMDRRFTEAGFTPTGTGDEMRCSSCNLEVDQWGPDDDPMDTHEKLSTQCPFILENARGTCMNHLCYYHAKTYQMDSFKTIRRLHYENIIKLFFRQPLHGMPEISL